MTDIELLKAREYADKVHGIKRRNSDAWEQSVDDFLAGGEAQSLNDREVYEKAGKLLADQFMAEMERKEAEHRDMVEGLRQATDDFKAELRAKCQAEMERKQREAFEAGRKMRKTIGSWEFSTFDSYLKRKEG
jgi:hypothetical protein